MKSNLDKCPFCNHVIMNRNSKCPNCNKKLEPILFKSIMCPHCNEKSILKEGACSKCGKNINIPSFEIGKYIEIPKKRRINLVSEREEKIYQKLKMDHLGPDSQKELEYLKKNALINKKYYNYILIAIAALFIVFSIIDIFTKAFIPETIIKNKSIKFYLPIFLWFIIKAVVFTGFIFFSKFKPIYSYISAITFLIIIFLFEILTFPNLPLSYIISQVIAFFALIYGAKLALGYEDYLTHYEI